MEMDEYRAYIIGPDGHITNRIDLLSRDENEARRLAKVAANGFAVELWQADRFIERFEPQVRSHDPATDGGQGSQQSE